MSRFVVIVLDSFGVGAMDDVSKVRPRDIGSSTAGHIIETNPSIQLPTLEKLGLMNALGYEIDEHKKSETAVFGKYAIRFARLKKSPIFFQTSKS